MRVTKILLHKVKQCVSNYFFIFYFSLTKDFTFQLTDPIRRNVYQFRTENSEETNLWLHHLNQAVNAHTINNRSSKNLMSFDWKKNYYYYMSDLFLAMFMSLKYKDFILKKLYFLFCSHFIIGQKTQCGKL